MRHYLLLCIGLLITITGWSQDINTELQKRAGLALVFCKENQMDTTFCILIDMGMHSGKNRLFVWDFNQHKVVRAGLCCHGVGKGSTCNLPVFSNQPGSRCTSLGKYKIGKRDYSRWGIHVHYKLHGLEETNNNAFKRIVVLHSFTAVPSKALYPQHLQLGYSFGCPVVSDVVMRDLDILLKKAELPVLLWIFYQ